MPWYDLAYNPLAISNLYTDVPSLTSVQVQSIQYAGDYLSLRIVIAFPFPDRVPKRWRYQGYKAVQVELSFSRLLNLQLVNTNPCDIVTIEIKKLAQASLLVEIYSQSVLVMKVNAEYFSLRINKLS